MNVLSLFDGMSCGQLALDKANIWYDDYFASEIDKFAIQVTQKNYPLTHQLGDITKIKESDLPKIDLLIGGSPCQGFSFAGKQLNFEDPRSKLFFEYVRLLKECKPKYFLLENVKMKKEYQDVISSFLGVEPIEINSALVSAQNRKRLYWTNIEGITQPEDRGILLKDILENENQIEAKYYLSKEVLKGMDLHLKANTQRCASGSCTTNKHNYQYIKINKKGYLKSNQDKGSTYTAGAKSGGNHSDIDLICVQMVGRKIDENGTRKDNDPDLKNLQRLEANISGKSNCLTSVKKDNLLLINANVRRLTPVEVERLQTVPDHYTSLNSNSQRYKMLGNGFTIDVIAHILSFMKL